MSGWFKTLEPGRWRQAGYITLGALAIFAVMRWLPTGTNLSHMDFRVTAKNSIDFCDPLNPQFIPVVLVASPVSMKLTSENVTVRPNEEAHFTVRLETSTGKRIVPEDLAVSHTRKLHVLLIDPSLNDYQHVHPEPGREPGEWTFSFTPKQAGVYRVFADFTPVATMRGLYASAELRVGPAGAWAEGAKTVPRDLTWLVERAGCRFALEPGTRPVRAGRPTDLKFSIVRADSGRVDLEPVMGAFAHLVAFDEARSGFAHLHPTETDLLKPLGPLRPVLNFKITIPRAGRYVIWAQVNLAGRETFVPFWFDVVP